jgi:hypothetical protein
MTVGSLPEQGQLVQVRERRWIVAEIEGDELRGDPLEPAAGLQHLISFSSAAAGQPRYARKRPKLADGRGVPRER